MQKTLLTPILLLLVTLAVPASIVAQERPDTRPGVAVFPFAAGISIGANRENLDALTVGLQDILITELAVNTALRLVDRSVIRNLMEEQDLGATERVDPTTAARLGKIVGARYAFTGGFNDMNGEFHLTTRIVDVETTEVIKAERIVDKRDRLYPMVMEMAERLTRNVNLPPLSTEVRRSREAGRAALPRDAVILYSQAQYFQDRGQIDRAKELYRRVTKEFPALTEAAEALRRLDSGS